MPYATANPKCTREHEMFARAVLELAIRGTFDAETIRRRVLFLAQAMDCPGAVIISYANLAEILGVSRQAVSQSVDKLALKIADIKADFANSDDGKLTLPSK